MGLGMMGKFEIYLRDSERFGEGFFHSEGRARVVLLSVV